MTRKLRTYAARAKANANGTISISVRGKVIQRFAGITPYRDMLAWCAGYFGTDNEKEWALRWIAKRTAA